MTAQLEEDKKHLEFMNSMKKYDSELQESTSAGGDDPASEVKSSKDLFGDDPDDQVQQGQGPGPGQSGSPTPPSQYVQQANAGYEIPARLRTLHNLVIQYASQGR